MATRRQILQTGLFGAGAMAMGSQSVLANSTTGKPPMRFIFLSKGNRLLPSSMVPSTLSEKEKAIESSKGQLDIDLENHELAEWMRPARGL